MKRAAEKLQIGYFYLHGGIFLPSGYKLGAIYAPIPQNLISLYQFTFNTLNTHKKLLARNEKMAY